MRSAVWRSDSELRVLNLKFLLPPSALKPVATAIASMRVDLPDPFSPTKNVTRGSRRSVLSLRTAGIENGYLSKDATRSRRRVTDRTNVSIGGLERDGRTT